MVMDLAGNTALVRVFYWAGFVFDLLRAIVFFCFHEHCFDSHLYQFLLLYSVNMFEILLHGIILCGFLTTLFFFGIDFNSLLIGGV